MIMIGAEHVANGKLAVMASDLSALPARKTDMIVWVTLMDPKEEAE